MRILVLITILMVSLTLVGCGASVTSSNATVEYSRYTDAVVGNSNPCWGTFDCEYWGECSFRDGACVASAAQCKKSRVCLSLGQCQFKGSSCTM